MLYQFFQWKSANIYLTSTFYEWKTAVILSLMSANIIFFRMMNIPILT